MCLIGILCFRFVPAAFPLLTSTTKKILALFICKTGKDTPEPVQAEQLSSLSPQFLHERCFMPLHSLMALSWTCSTITPLCSTREPSTRPRTAPAAPPTLSREERPSHSLVAMAPLCSQDATGLAHGHLMSQDTQGLSCKAAPQPPACAGALGGSSRDEGLGLCQTPGGSWGCSAPSAHQHNFVISPQSGTVCNPAEGAP